MMNLTFKHVDQKSKGKLQKKKIIEKKSIQHTDLNICLMYSAPNSKYYNAVQK